MKRYLNPDKSFNEKLYYEDQVKMLAKTNSITGVLVESHQTTITFTSGRTHTYPMRLEV